MEWTIEQLLGTAESYPVFTCISCSVQPWLTYFSVCNRMSTITFSTTFVYYYKLLINRISEARPTGNGVVITRHFVVSTFNGPLIWTFSDKITFFQFLWFFFLNRPLHLSAKPALRPAADSPGTEKPDWPVRG